MIAAMVDLVVEELVEVTERANGAIVVPVMELLCPILLVGVSPIQMKTSDPLLSEDSRSTCI